MNLYYFKNIYKYIKMTLQGELNIAVLIYGRLKKANDSFSHIKNSLKKYNNVDFFLSTDNANSNEI